MGDYLLSVKQREKMGFSWETTPFKTNNLTGFAHGVAGISNALFELFEFSGEEKFKIVAEAGIQYENYYFDKKEQNWPDFRDFNYLRKNENEQTPCSCAWCHGAPGIGLSRLRAFEITGNELYKEDAMLAINTTIKNNAIKKSGNFSLCHGLFGNSELLIEASKTFKNNEYLKFAESIGLMGIDLYIKESIPFVKGVYNDFENPEFMTGTAGMGYFYLRLFDPEEFPCILSVHLANKSRKQILKKPIRLLV
jgi:lantibiotic modifying enzyme